MSRKQTRTDVPDRGSISLFSRDDRGIEGLPIRLVIAIVIGVAAMAVMMTMLDGLDQFNDEEIEIAFEEGEGVVFDDGTVDFEVKVVDESGDPVEGATVSLVEGTAQIEGGDSTRVESTNEDGVAEFTNVDISLKQGQDEGTIEFDLSAPDGSDYEVAEDLEELTVLAN